MPQNEKNVALHRDTLELKVSFTIQGDRSSFSILEHRPEPH